MESKYETASHVSRNLARRQPLLSSRDRVVSLLVSLLGGHSTPPPTLLATKFINDLASPPTEPIENRTNFIPSFRSRKIKKIKIHDRLSISIYTSVDD